MKIINMYVPYALLMQQWGLSADQLRSLCYGENKVITPYFKTEKRTNKANGKSTYIVEEFNLDPVYGDGDSVNVYNNVFIVFDFDAVVAHQKANPALTYDKEDITEGSLFFESIFPSDFTSVSILATGRDTLEHIDENLAMQNINKYVLKNVPKDNSGGDLLKWAKDHLHELSPKDKRHVAAWIYRREEGCTVEELADHLQKSKRTAETYLAEAKKLLGANR